MSSTKFKPSDLLLLFILAAIWGASFLFMRILAPHLPAFLIANLRILSAGFFLLVLYIYWQRDLLKNITHNYKTLSIIGLFNSGIPFFLYAFAAHHIPAAYSAVLNALTPVFTALIARFYLKTEISAKAYFGLVLGVIGVYVLMQGKLAEHDFMTLWRQDPKFLLSIFACILATLCYGIGTNFTKKHGQGLSIQVLSTGSQILIGLMMLPIGLYFDMHHAVLNLNLGLIAAILALGIVCSGVAYTLFFRLLKNGGPIYASMTTFLIPLFGMFWAYVFLGEAIASTTYLATGVILLATFLVLK